MIGKWFGESYVFDKALDLDKLCKIKGGLVKVLKLYDRSRGRYLVKDYKTGETFHFEDYILQIQYKEIPEAKVILYGL